MDKKDYKQINIMYTEEYINNIISWIREYDK